MKHVFGIIWAASFVGATALGVVKLGIYILERLT